MIQFEAVYHQAPVKVMGHVVECPNVVIADLASKISASYSPADGDPEHWIASRLAAAVGGSFQAKPQPERNVAPSTTSKFVWGDEFEKGKGNPCHVPSGPSGGQFCSTTSGGAVASGLVAAAPNREEWPAHIKEMKIPPAWTDVRINPDPKANLQVVGKDSKGRAQYVYSKEFQDAQAQATFARVKELDAKYERIRKQNQENQKSDDPKVREHADCAAVVMTMGVRPGSDTDTQAKVKAYGATTLLGKHVVQSGEETRLQFTGKKGVALDLPVDRSVAAMLRSRATAAGADGKLFPNVTGSSLLDYSHTLNGGKFKTKDFRTLVATRTATEAIKGIKPPTTQKEYVKSVRAVAKTVAEKLGNTPIVALQSYIHPAVFAPWRASL